MSKIWENNFVKLPVIFLSVGVVCTAALSLVNTVTSKKIDENEKNKALQIYGETFKDFYSEGSVPEFTIDNTLEVSDSLKAKGISGKISVSEKSGKLVGYIYEGKVNGFAGVISFQVSFANDSYHNFTVVSNTETKKKGLNYIVDNLKDYSLSDPNFFETDSYKAGVSGASKSDDALIPALNECASDYMSMGK